MLPNRELIQSLDELENLFQQATNPRDSLMHAKHAMLELCGWIEEAEDDLVLRCASKIPDSSLKSLIAKKVENNYAFHYEDKFLPLLGMVIGLQKYSQIKIKLQTTGTKFLSLSRNINDLKKPRNSHAHTHFDQSKQQSNQLLTGLGPSAVKQKALDIYLGFTELEKSLKKHRLI